MSNTSFFNPHLIPIEPVKQCDAHDRGPDASHVRQSGETRRLHLNVLDSGLAQLTQIAHLVRLGEVAEGAVQATLACWQKLMKNGGLKS